MRKDVVLRAVVIAGLWLASTAALAESLRLETDGLVLNKLDCRDSKDHDLRINACSATIRHNRKDAVAYHNRGEAYGLKGDIERAISDYTKAIELNPSYAPAYYARASTYVSKGDYTRAVADVTKAGEITRNERKPKGAAKKKPAKETWWAWAIRKLTN